MYRSLPVLVMAGALLASACSSLADRIDLDAPAGSGTPESAATSPSEAPPDDVHYRWEVGDCILVEDSEDLPYAPFGRETVVACGDPHAYEVFFTGRFEEGETDPYPEDIGERAWETCAAAFESYIGVHLVESGLSIVLYQPDRSEWAGGLRYQACVVHDPSPGGDLPLSTGSLAGVGDAVPFAGEIGDCYESRAARGPEIDCDQAHRTEIIGFVTFDDGVYQGFDAFGAEADARCAEELSDYVRPGAAGPPVSPVSFTRALTKIEWDDGLRTVPCFGLVFDSDRRHVLVVGSLADPDWWVIVAGQAA